MVKIEYLANLSKGRGAKLKGLKVFDLWQPVAGQYSLFVILLCDDTSVFAFRQLILVGCLFCFFSNKFNERRQTA
jgi:hypothetical protein